MTAQRGISSGFTIRPYRRGDRQAVRDICVACCWMGQYRPEFIPDDWTWEEYWTRYFTDRQSRYTYVACRPDGSVAGYLSGTPQAHQADLYGLTLLPGVALHVVTHRLLRRQPSRAAIGGMLGAILRGEMDCPPGVLEAFPATMHVNLMPDARGCGLAGGMFDALRRRLIADRCPGMHARPLSVNAAVQRFHASRGFRLVDSRPLHAFAHVHPAPIEVQTWVLAF